MNTEIIFSNKNTSPLSINDGAGSTGKIELPRGRDNNFNFLRFLFATLVILSHSPELVDSSRERELLSRVFHTVSFGELAVDEFFLLSGFMIMKSWNTQPLLVNFLKKRILRIYPAYVIAALLSAFIFGSLGTNNPLIYLNNFKYREFFSSLLVLAVPNTPATFVGTPSPQVNGSIWSLSYELYCYLAIAFFGVLGLNKRRCVWLFILVATVSVSVLLLVIEDLNVAHKNFIIGSLSVPTRLFLFFSTGACFYLYQDKIKLKAIIAFLMLPLLAYLLYIPAAVNITLAILGGYVTFYFAFRKIHFLHIFKTAPDISYGIYLYAWPIQKVFLWYFQTMSPWLLFGIAFICSSLLGYLSWILFEEPALKMIPKIKFNSNKIAVNSI